LKIRGGGLVDAGWGEDNRAFLREKVDAKAPLGLLAIEDDEPLGWVAVAPRTTYPRLTRSKVTHSDGDSDTWSVTCFFVHRTARRQGLAGTLLDAAVDWARSRGAVAVEGHPVDTEGERCGSDELYHGTLAMFLAAGFELVDRRGTRRALVRRAA
jgi:GNAT superfamily N-acetyltransferase